MAPKITTETSVRHVIRVEMKDFRRLMEVPDALDVYSVWYDGGAHVVIHCSGSVPPVVPPAPPDQLPKPTRWRWTK